MSTHLLHPVLCPLSSLQDWEETESLVFNAARLWNKYAPRGKGAIPRFLGRNFGKNLKLHILTASQAKLAVQPSSLDVYVNIVNNGGTWNNHVLETCESLLKSGQTFWDVGANVGIISIEMAHRFKGLVNVISFEPQPDLALSIATSNALNQFGRSNVFDVMLGESKGSMNLYLTSHTIHASGSPRENHSRCLERTVTTIDSLVEDGVVLPPNVIKMDIEGGELSALNGAKRALSKYQPHLIFEADENMSRFGYELNDILNLLSDCAPYHFYFIKEDATLTEVSDRTRAERFSDILATVVPITLTEASIV